MSWQTREEIEIALRKARQLAEQTLVCARPVCTKCEFYDFNEQSDEAYCAAKDYEPIRLYRKHRPNWCPRLKKGEDC